MCGKFLDVAGYYAIPGYHKWKVAQMNFAWFPVIENTFG